MRKKDLTKFLFTTSLFIGLALKSSPIYATDYIKDEPVKLDKVWTIKFNHEIKFDNSVKNAIIVNDSKGIPVTVFVELSDDNKSILVHANENSYKPGETYKLIVGTDIYDVHNHKLKESASMTFTVEESPALAELIALAEASLLKGDFQKLIDKSTEAINTDLNEAKPYIYRAYGYFRLNASTERGLKDIDKALQIEPNNYIAILVKGFLYGNMHDLQTAKTYISKGVNFTPKNSVEYYFRGLGFMNLLEFDKGLADLDKSIELKANSADAYLSKAVIHYFLQDYSTTVEECNKALDINPNLGDAYDMRGSAYRWLGEYDKSLSDLNKAIGELKVNNEDVFLSRGMTYMYLEEFNSAITDFNKVISLNSNNGEAYLGRGISYLSLNKPEDSLKDFNKAIGLLPNDPDIYSLRGGCYIVLGEYDNALAHIYKALELDPDNELANQYLEIIGEI